MATQELISAQRRSLQQIQTLVERDLRAFFGTLNPRRPGDSMAELIRFIPELTARYGDIAATLAAEWYEAVRDAAGVGGGFVAQMTTDLDPAKAIILARWGSQPLFETGDTLLALSRIAGGAQRIIANTSRDTILTNTAADPANTGRWSRDARGSACAFCMLLASRGPVYTSRDTGDFNAHDKCYCIAVPDFDDYQEPEHVSTFLDSYYQARADVGGQTKDILSELRQTTGAS